MFIWQLYNVLLHYKSIHKFNIILDNFDTIERINELPIMMKEIPNIRVVIKTDEKNNFINKYGKEIFELSRYIELNQSFDSVETEDEKKLMN